NLTYHRRGNLAVCLGVVVGTAVLTGALLVGDSLRGSLRDLSERQLEWIDYALIPGRFFGEDLDFAIRAEHVVATTIFQGSAAGSAREAPADSRRLARVTIFGVMNEWNHRSHDPKRWTISRIVPDWRLISISVQVDEVALNEQLAKELGVQVGG